MCLTCLLALVVPVHACACAKAVCPVHYGTVHIALESMQDILEQEAERIEAELASSSDEEDNIRSVNHTM